MLIIKNNEDLIQFRKDYEIWYSEALSLVNIVLSNRTEDFEKYYHQKGKKRLSDYIAYTPPRNKGMRFKFPKTMRYETFNSKKIFLRKMIDNQFVL